MKDFNYEIEQLLATGRGMSEAEFDNLLDKYFVDKTDAEKEQIGVAVLKTKISKFNELKRIDNEIADLRLSHSDNMKNVVLKLA